MKATKQIDIYITNKRNVRVIDVVQYDTGIHLVFTVKDFDIPSGATAKLYVQKPSGKFVFQEDGITIVENTILVNLENQAITEHGKVPYQVSITNGSDMITTFTGLMMVEKSLKDSNATESKTVIRAFDEVVSDHVAEFRAKAEQIVQACIATIPEDYTVMEAKVNELANAIKGSVSGAVVAVDDVSTVGHSPVVKVHGKNLIPFPYAEQSTTRDGVTFTVNDDGGVLLTGTATVNTSFNIVMQYQKRLPVKKGKKYVLSCNSTFTEDTGYVYLQNWVNGVGVDSLSVRKGSVLFEPSQDGYIQIGIVLLKGKTYNETVYIQLEEGSVATEYEAWLDPTVVTVRRCGRNIIPYPYKETETTRQGITWREKATGKYLASGTTDDTGSYIMVCTTESKRLFLVAGVVYHFSCIPKESGLYYAYVKDASGTNFFDHGAGATFTPTASGFGAVTIVVSSNVTISDIEFKPQLEIGTEKTFFEKPCEEAVLIPAADGTVSGMTSLSPNMTILTDTDGAIVECEYIVDTKTYIDNKIKEMMEGVTK